MLNPKLIRITTVPISLKILLKGQHRFMSENGFEVLGVSSSGKELQEVENEEEIRTVSLEMTRTISPVKDLKALWSFYRLCKKEKPLIVHSHTPKAGIVGMLGAKLAGVTIRMHTVAGLPLMEATGVKRKILDMVEKLTYASATKIYPISYGLEQFILKNAYTSKEKIKVIANGSSNGFDLQYFNPNQISEDQKHQLKFQLKIDLNDFVFVFVGRLVSDKGVNELVKAFSKLNQSNVKLMLVGAKETALDPLAPNTLMEIQNNSNIISVGFQKDVRPYLAISDALILPSYREGFGSVIAQAGLMNLPSIVSDITGCNEIIVEGKNGTIIPVKNSKSIFDAMVLFMQDKVYYNHLKENARPMICDRYEQRLVWEALLEEYRLLEGEGQ